MARTLVTHVRPHLDDLAGMWLIRKYLPGWQQARLRFVPAATPDPKRTDTICVGMGRGKFDEHKGDIGETAVSLVWKFVRPRVASKHLRSATDRLVAWIRDEDLGAHLQDPLPELGLSAQLYAYFERHGRDSAKLADFGFELLENALVGSLQAVEQEHAWSRRKELRTRWGRGVALTTPVPGMDGFAYRKGFALLVLIHPRKGYRQFRADPRSTVDLSAIAREVKRREPRVPWFLHHSKRMLLSGSDVAPGGAQSKLTLKELIWLATRKK